jgi:hypothetical protein
MKKYINKLAFIGLFVIFGLTACDQENNRGLYDISLEPAFSMYQPALVAALVPEDNGVLKVALSRTNANEEATVSVTLTSANAATLNLFKLESSTVKFAKGEYQANANILFTIADLSTSASYSLELAIPDSEASLGGNKSTTITAARKVTWKSIGTGIWLNSTMWGIVPADNEPVGVEQAIEAPELYRLVEFFNKPIMMKIDQNNVVSISMQATGVTSGNGEVFMNCTGTYNPATKIINLPRVNAANPQNYYYYPNGASYSAGWYLEEIIQLP